MIPYGRQDISQEDIDAVITVLKSDYLTQGPAVPIFEKAISNYCGVTHAIAVNSATSALHIACLALGVVEGDCVWTTPTTFVASANCALYCGATVDFVDIDPRTYNLSVERLAEKLHLAEKVGKLPKAVIPVHLCGQSCDMEGIHKLSQRYGFKIIEDASHAIGGKYKDKLIGDCQFSDITVFSFHPVKIVTTGEGGIAVTNDDTLARNLRLLRSHGITSEAAHMEARPLQEIWNYQQIALGFNYRMTDIQAALGISQMNRLGEFITKRHSIAAQYNQELLNLPIQTPWQHQDTSSSYHLYPIRIRPENCGKSQRQIYDDFISSNILVNLHYIPVYRHPYFQKKDFQVGYCPEAEKYHKESISLPIYPTLTAKDLEKVISVLKFALS